MATRREKIISKAIEELKPNPNGVHYSDLARKIQEELPNIPINTINGTIWNLETHVPNEVYKPARGLFRHIIFREEEISEEEQKLPPEVTKNKVKASGKKAATQFEGKIKQFLQNLEFNDVDGARDDFLINGIQVDVCGGWENALLVIECKSKQKLGEKNLRSAINEFRGKRSLLERGFKNHPKYSKYTFFKYIIVTKNIKVRHADYKFAQ